MSDPILLYELVYEKCLKCHWGKCNICAYKKTKEYCHKCSIGLDKPCKDCKFNSLFKDTNCNNNNNDNRKEAIQNYNKKEIKLTKKTILNKFINKLKDVFVKCSK